jgi:hypothetical protein
MGDGSSYSVSTLVTPGAITLSESENSEALADSLETQIQPLPFLWCRQLLRLLTWYRGLTS